jgi:hypothetical protein
LGQLAVIDEDATFGLASPFGPVALLDLQDCSPRSGLAGTRSAHAQSRVGDEDFSDKASP